MTRSFITKLILVISVLATSTLAPLPALAAYDPLGKVNCTQAADSAACNRPGTDPITGPDGILIKATNIIAIIAGVAAVIFLVLAGIKYITSNGAPDQISKAKESIIYALVGLVMIAISRAVIGFIIGRL